MRRVPPTEESPLAKAKRIYLTPGRHGLTQRSQRHLERIYEFAMTHAKFAALLDRDGAPLAVLRWVAEAQRVQGRTVRYAIILLMRREADPRNPGTSVDGWAWPKDRLFRAAERLFWESPQHTRLVEMGVLAARDALPNLAQQAAFTMDWERAWATVQREFASIDRRAFRERVEQIVAQRRRRRRRVKMRPTDIAAVEALDTLKRLVTRGEITLGDLSEIRSKESKEKKR